MNMPVATNIGIAVMAMLCMAMLWRSLTIRQALSAPDGCSAPGIARQGTLSALDFTRETQRTIDLRQVLEEAPQHGHSLLKSRDITWTQVMPQGPLDVFARPQELQQLLAHVVALACQAMPRGGVLSVVAKAHGVQAVIQFCDAGRHGQQPLLSGLFQHGARALAGADAVDSELVASVASCRRIVHEHGGRIETAPSSTSGELALTVRLPLRAGAANWSRY